MARTIVTIIRCDMCGSDQDVEKRRVGRERSIYLVELCGSCRLPLDEILKKASGRQRNSVRFHKTTPEEIEQAQRRFKGTE